jgi:hypothetical protein
MVDKEIPKKRWNVGGVLGLLEGPSWNVKVKAKVTEMFSLVKFKP